MKQFTPRSTICALLAAVSAATWMDAARSTTGTLAGSNCSTSNFKEGDPGACLFGVSSTVTNGAALRVNSGVTSEAIRRDAGEDDQLGLRQGISGHTGLAAGEDFAGFGVWSSYAHSDFEGDFVFANADLGYDGDSDSVYIGIDRLFAGQFVIGLAVGYEDTSSTTGFNGGEADTNGFTIAPYAAWLINDVFSIDVSGGYGSLETDQNRISTIDGSRVDAAYDSSRRFFAANLNAIAVRGDWTIGGQLGVLRTIEEQDGFRETGNAASAGRLWTVRERDVSLSQFVAALDVGFAIGQSGFEPFGRVAYRNDLSRDNGVDSGGLMPFFTEVQPDDDDEWELGGGIRYFGNVVSGGAEFLTTEGRDGFDNWSVLVSGRVDF